MPRSSQMFQILFDTKLISIDSTASTTPLDWYIYVTACDQLGPKNSNNVTICSSYMIILWAKSNVLLYSMALLIQAVLSIFRVTSDPSNLGDNDLSATPVFSWNTTANNLADDRPGIPGFHTSMTLSTTTRSGQTNRQDCLFDR